MSGDQTDSRGAAPRERGQRATRKDPASPPHFVDVTEQKRLNDARETGIPWKKWGPYLSERQWGTVREDYSQDGNAWAYFSHDQSRSRAYRWGEDGLGGFSDDEQRLCFALALWNERDPILKERAFGLTNSEGNHGEDVKEYYFYLDSTPTHSYMKYLYKYPQREFPYRDLIETNRRRSRGELSTSCSIPASSTTTGTSMSFSSTPRQAPDDILIRVTVHNRGPEAARLQLLPTLWFRNTWSWKAGSPKPSLREADGAIRASHPELGDYTLYCEEPVQAPARRTGTALHGEREQLSAALGAAERVAVGQGRLPPVRRCRGRRGGQPGADRHQGRGALHPRRARRRLSGRPPPVVGRRPGPSCAGWAVRSGIRRDVWSRVSPTPTSSTSGSPPRR